MTDNKSVNSNAGVSPKGARRTIAVIDDEHKWLKVFQRMFRNSPYAVDTFDNPHSAILDKRHILKLLGNSVTIIVFKVQQNIQLLVRTYAKYLS